jgi:iron complex transport system permease protein
MTGGARTGARVLAALALLWLIVLVVAPFAGSHTISPGAVWSGEDATAATIFWQLRLPRVLLALLAGGALAVSGVAYQTVFRNPLAEPYTLGVAVGAALGAVVAIRFLGDGDMAGLPLVAAASFLGALGATAVVFGLAHRQVGGGSTAASTLLLAGIAVSLSATALILFIQYLSDSTQTFRMVRWTMGALAVVGYGEVLWVAPWAVGGSLLFLLLRWDLNQLLTGEELAASRGVELRRLRLAVLGASSLMVGALVAIAGPIGFVGLMVPHIVRRWVGADHLVLLPACLLGGGIFLTLCDTLGRMVLAPAELPVGIVTALLGGPFFLWLVFTGRRG